MRPAATAAHALRRALSPRGVTQHAAPAAGDVELTAEQQAEYRELKLRADGETVGDLAALAQARAAVDALEPSAAAAEEQLGEMHAQLEALDNDIGEVRRSAAV